MGKGSRLKQQRQQQRDGIGSTAATPRAKTRGSAASDIHAALLRRDSRRTNQEIARWLAQAVWREQRDMNCLEASYTLSAALELFGIRNRIVPVAMVADNFEAGEQRVCGQAGLDFLVAQGAPIDATQTVRKDESFWDDGGHAVVVLEEDDLFLDPTIDQFNLGRSFIFERLSHATQEDLGATVFTFGGTAEGPSLRVVYVEVDDDIELEEAVRTWMSAAASELAAVGVIVDFDPVVVEPKDFPLYPLGTFIDSITDELEKDDFTSLERLRARRAAGLATLDHHEQVPVVWGFAPL